MNKASSLGGKARTTPLGGQSALQAGMDGLGYTNLPPYTGTGEGAECEQELRDCPELLWLTQQRPPFSPVIVPYFSGLKANPLVFKCKLKAIMLTGDI